MVKEAHMDDLAAIVNMIKKYRKFYKVENQNEEEIEQFVKSRLKNAQSKIFLATNETDKVVGFAQLYPSYSTVSLKPQWILNDFFVEVAYRHKGYGQALMSFVKEYFRDKAKGFILVTDIDNFTAKSFYEQNGWKTGEHDFYTFFYE